VPVVAREGRFVYAQVLRDVIEFLGLNEASGPSLTPAVLAGRADAVIAAAARLCRQMPDAALENQLPHRPRSWRVLMHHIFQIGIAFLDSDESGAPLTYEALTAPPSEDLRSSAAIAAFGEQARVRFGAWWQAVRSEDFERTVTPYFGKTTRHEMLERAVWHMAQHARQLATLLEQEHIAPDRPLTAEDIRGLPLSDKVWDEM
jgi:DinB superfamily